MSEAITNLREALKYSPDNLPLRMMLAEALMVSSYFEEAENEYKAALKLNPADEKIKLGYSKACYMQHKNSIAVVIVEELLQAAAPVPYTFLLHAKLLHRDNRLADAAQQYQKAIALDPALKDMELEEALKVKSTEGIHGLNEAELFEEVEGMERPVINFSDVGGMNHVKEEIKMKIILPMQHPELYAAYGKKIGGGILLYGPPGCGKTLLARATAGQVHAGFIPVGISDILDMYIGSSEQRLHQLFEKARQQKPCVLFFDEVDALGASRSDMKHSAGRHLINQFLAELDGVQASNEGLLILGATNAPWNLDGAFRRPGRFDRILFITPPDEPARIEILKVLLKGKPVAEIDYKVLAGKTKEFSGADLKAVVDNCVEDKLREAMQQGLPSKITTSDLLQAAKKVYPSTKEWFTTARNYALYANESGLYNEVLEYLGIKK